MVVGLRDNDVEVLVIPSLVSNYLFPDFERHGLDAYQTPCVRESQPVPERFAANKVV